MRFDLISLFPDEVQNMMNMGVTGRAIRDGLISLQGWNPRDLATDRHRTVDDRPYGGGPGMLMKIEPLRSCIQMVRKQDDQAAKVVYLTPQGEKLDHQKVMDLSNVPRLIVVCGRYEGIDERLIQTEVDQEISIGDYVLSGGELAAAVLIDAVARQVPGVLGDADSAQQDSFATGLLDCPHYTRPEEDAAGQVPKILLQGNHAAIARWRHQQALGRTWQRRPDVLEHYEMDQNDQQLLDEFINDLKSPEGE